VESPVSIRGHSRSTRRNGKLGVSVRGSEGGVSFCKGSDGFGMDGKRESTEGGSLGKADFELFQYLKTIRRAGGPWGGGKRAAEDRRVKKKR